ncbi:MAG: tetratricopeptide repeat protein [Planctomycetota bacterium]
MLRRPAQSVPMAAACAALFLTLAFLPGCQSYRQQVREARALAFVDEAEQHREQGDDEQALVAFAMAIEVNPKLTAAHLGVGSIYKDRGDLEQASQAYENAVGSDANSFEAHASYGLVLHLMGRLREAVSSYLRAIPIDPDDAEVRRHLASAYMQLNDPAAALPHALRAAELNPDSQSDWANLASNYALLGQFEDAVDAYRQAAELGDMAEPVLLGLADAHIRLGNHARAINTLNTLIFRAGPAASATAFERLGVAQYRLRRYEDALRSFARALSIDPNDIAALNGTGAAYMTLYIEGDRDNATQKQRAMEAWRRSIRLQPQQPRITDLVSRYANL